MKAIQWVKENILFVASLFLLAFIPLYPKLPLITVTHTFVYIRADDFFVAFAFILFFIQLLRKKATIKTPLSYPILSYWIIGLIATLLGVIFIFPHLQGVFPKIAALFWLRHIEYIGLFFIAFASLRNKKQIPWVIGVLLVTLTTVVLYGIGQRFIPSFFPAFSTMNEEFAKGIPLTLSALGRIQSTFAGHYDLAAYLVMLIPLVGSLVFGVKHWGLKISFIVLGLLSLMVLLMTASRTSFAMYLLAIIFMLVIQKQKKWIIPVIIVSLVLLRSFTGIYSRYAATFAPVNVIVDARTGKAIGIASNSGDSLVVNDEQSTGENLPQGSQYLQGQKVGTASNVTIKSQKGGSKSIDIQNLQGNFIVKKAQALDISITTRLQAEWPNAIQAFKRDVLFGSGYSSISLATDGNYFRILGETGLLGFISFILIFFIYGIYVYRVLPQVNSPLARSLTLGMAAGIFGLALNAILIDVFESSKVAYTLWLLMGFSVGILHLYQEKLKINYLKDIKTVVFSLPVVLSSIFVTGILVFFQMLNNFFVADDFTWLRWIADCTRKPHDNARCLPFFIRVWQFFTHSSDFFYRPMEKVFFLIMYGNKPNGSTLGGLNPALYHVMSLLGHLLVTVAVFFIVYKLLKNKLHAYISAMLFLVLGGHAEAIYWVSSSGHVFASLCIVWGLLAYMQWIDKKNKIFLIISSILIFLAPLFQEAGVVGILMIFGYHLITSGEKNKLFEKLLDRTILLWYGIPLIIYFLLKFVSGSFWSAGDYKYNILKLPFNFIGNYIGAIGISLMGTNFMPIYTALRDAVKHQTLLASLAVLIALVFAYFIFELRKELSSTDKRVLLVVLLFIIVPFLPFAGFGNIAPRYVYLSSFGVILFFVFLLEKLFILLKKPLQIHGSYVIIILLALGAFIYQTNLVRAGNTDWEQAGMITNNFVLYLNDQYESLYGIKHQIFYFTNVPIRHNEAWVFPVGLPDAVWFDYKEKKPQVIIVPTVTDAKAKAGNNPSAVIFSFDKDGNIAMLGSR